MKNTFLKKYFGDKAFYKMVLGIIVPLIIQNEITNFVNLLDNIMVGQMGTEQMSGVAIANQLNFVYNLAIFGALSGIGIFTAQFFGAKNEEGARQTLRLKFYVCSFLLAIFVVLALTVGDKLIMLYLTKGTPEEIAMTMDYGKRYLYIMLIGLVPSMIAQCLGFTLKESGNTTITMRAGITAVLVNLVGNYLLIFGNFGCPRMGAVGAAVATVIARFVECGIIVWTAVRHSDRFTFMKGLFRSLTVDSALAKKVAVKGFPLLVNEFLWAFGLSAISQSYSTRGIDAVAATNIQSTVYNMFTTIYFSFGTVISIIVGQALGQGDGEKAKELARKVTSTSVLMSATVGIIAFFLSPLFPGFYNVAPEVKELATNLLRVASLCMPIGCLVHSCYFTIRSGGKTVITFLFDSFFMIAVAYPVSFILSRFTGMPLVPMYLCIQLLDIIKVVIGLILVKKGIWVNNLVKDEEKKEISAE